MSTVFSSIFGKRLSSAGSNLHFKLMESKQTCYWLMSSGKKILTMYYVPILEPMDTSWDIKFIRFILHWHSEWCDFFIDAAFMVPSSLWCTWERDLGTVCGSSALWHIWLDTSKAVRDAGLKLTQCRLKHHFCGTQSKMHELKVPEAFCCFFSIWDKIIRMYQ